MQFWALILYAFFVSGAEQVSSDIPPNNTSVRDPQEGQHVPGCVQSPIHLAAAAGDLAKVWDQLEKGFDVYSTDCNGLTPMHLAVLHRRSDVILALLEKGFDLNRDLKGVGTVLEFAMKNSIDMTQTLIELGGNINEIFPPNGESYIHRAVAGGNFSWTKTLIHLGADLEAIDWSDNTPIKIAVVRNNPAMVNLLTAAGAKVNKGNLLHLALKHNSTDCLRRLLGRGLPVDVKDEDGYTPIILAVRENKAVIVEIFTGFKANLDQRKHGMSLLHIAVEHNSTDSLRRLLARGLPVDVVDVDGYTPIALAVRKDNLALVEILVNFKANLDQRVTGKSLLVIAVENASIKSIEWLMQRGLKVDDNSSELMKAALNKDYVFNDFILFCVNYTCWDFKQNGSGDTLLRRAIETSNHKSLRLLLEGGLKLYDGCKLAEAAIDKDDTETLDILKEFGLNFNIECRDGGSLLHYAAYHGSVPSISWLVEYGLDINGTDSGGRIPLHLAVLHDHPPAVRTLVELGSCLDCIIKESWSYTPFLTFYTPLDIATNNGNTEIMDYLRQKTSQV